MVTTTFTAPAACAGAVAVIEVALLTIKLAALPPNVTELVPVKLVPVIVTPVPPAVGPEFGLTLLTVGGGVVTVNVAMRVVLPEPLVVFVNVIVVGP